MNPVARSLHRMTSNDCHPRTNSSPRECDDDEITLPWLSDLLWKRDVPNPITSPLKADSADDSTSQRDSKHKGDLTQKRFSTPETKGATWNDLRVALRSRKLPLADSQRESKDVSPSTARNSASDGHKPGSEFFPTASQGKVLTAQLLDAGLVKP